MACSRPPSFHIRRFGLCVLAAGLIVLSITGCVRLLEPRQSNITYYLLNSTSGDTLSTDTTGLKVGLRQPTLAPYLDAARIVTRHGPNEVQFSEFQRWGEHLSEAINRVVALNLENQSGIQSVETVPWRQGASFDYVVRMHVLRFEGKGPQPPGPEADDDAPIPEGHSQMVVRWTILGPDSETVRAQGTTRHQQGGWPVTDYGALVSRLEASLGVLADEIGTRLVTLNHQ